MKKDTFSCVFLNLYDSMFVYITESKIFKRIHVVFIFEKECAYKTHISWI